MLSMSMLISMTCQSAPARRQLPADLTPEGMMPPGDYPLTIEEFAASMLVVAPARRSSTWDTEWRARLVENLGVLVAQLWPVGITEIFIDGSFVEDKDHPNDTDGYF